MKIEFADQGKTTVVNLSGTLDGIALAAHRAAADVIVSAPGMEILIDMAGVPFVDASGIGMLVSVLKRAGAKNRRVALANVAGQPAELLSALKLGQAFGVTLERPERTERDVIVAATSSADIVAQAA